MELLLDTPSGLVRVIFWRTLTEVLEDSARSQLLATHPDELQRGRTLAEMCFFKGISKIFSRVHSVT